jgi:hypothetical protein
MSAMYATSSRVQEAVVLGSGAAIHRAANSAHFEQRVAAQRTSADVTTGWPRDAQHGLVSTAGQQRQSATHARDSVGRRRA